MLKNAELLAICLKDIGDCSEVERYLPTFLNDPELQPAITNVVHELVRCHGYQNTKLDPELQSKINEFFNLKEIDVGAGIQLSDFLNGAYYEDKELDDFFYLIEYGYSPALKALRQVRASNRIARNRLVIAGGACIALIVLGFYLSAVQRQKKHLTKEKIALLTGKEKETSRLSVDLHDILGYKIIELKDKANKIKVDPPKSKTELLTGLDELHQSMRYIVQTNLTPESLKFGLGPALDTLFNRVMKLGSVDFNLYKHGLDKRTTAHNEKHIFYIIQELVSNIIKHSRASKATFEISRLDKELVIIAEDNGIGYTPTIDTLKTVKARVDYLKGNVIEDVELDKGSTIIVNIPL